MKHQKLLRSTLQVLCSTLVLIVIFTLPRSVFAANGIAKVINFQGKVTNYNGTNVTDGTYDFVIKIYDGVSSGASTLFTETWSTSALWSSTMSSAPISGGESLTYSTDTNESTIKVGQILWNTTKKESVIVTSVNTGTNVIGISPTRQAWTGSDTITNKIYVKDGVFKVAINSLNSDLSGVNFNTDQIFMGVEFNSDGEMKPRIQYTATPYAFNAEKVNGLTVTNTSSNPFSSATTLKIGDGKTVQIDNGLRFTGTDGTQFTFPTASGTVVTADSTAVLTNKSIGSGGLTFSGATTDITTGTNEDLSIVPNGTGRIGLGTTNPFGFIDIRSHLGTVPAATISAISSFASLLVDQAGTGDIFTASASGRERFSITNSGALRLNGSVGTSSQCLFGGSEATWGTCGTAANYLQLNSGTLAPGNLASAGDKLVLGGATTTSFQFEVNGRQTGKALVSLNETGDQDIFTASKSGMTKFVIDRNGNVGIGTTAPNAKLQILSDFGTSATSSISARSSFAGLVVDNTVGDLFTASSSGLPRFTILQNGGVRINTLNTASCDVKADTTGLLTCGTDANPTTMAFSAITGGTNSSAAMIIDTGASLTFANSGTINASTLGGATFAAPGAIGSGTPSTGAFTTLSANATGTGLTLSGAGTSLAFSGAGLAQITTAASQHLALMPGGNVGIGTTAPNAKLQVLGDFGTGATSSISARSSFAGFVVDNIVGDLFSASSSGLARFTIKQNGNIGIGTTTPSGLLQLGAGTTTMAPFVFTSGTNLTAAQAGAMEWDGTNLYITQTSGPTRKTLAFTDSTLTGSIGFDKLTGATNTSAAMIVGAGASLNFSSTGTINASSLGGATFAAPGAIGSSTPGSGAFTTLAANSTLTLSANGATIAFSGTSGTNQITTASNQNLAFMPNGAGLVGVGTTSPVSELHVTRALSSGANGKALVILDQIENQDIFSASAAGVAKFTINRTGSASMSGGLTFGDGTAANNILKTPFGPLVLQYKSGANAWSNGLYLQDTTGNVGIGTTSPAGKLEVAGNTIIFGEGEGANPHATTIRGAAAGGVDVAGTNLTFDASNGTGSGGSGAFIFRTSSGLAGTVLAPTYDTSSATSGTSTTSISWSHTMASGSNKAIFVGVSIRQEGALKPVVSSVTFNGTENFTLVGAVPNDGKSSVEIWRLLNPTSTTANIVVTLDHTATEVEGGATSWTGVNQTTPTGTFASNNGNDITPTVNVSSATNEVVIDTAASVGVFNTPGAGQTQRWNVSINGNGNGAGSTETGASTTTMSWTLNGIQQWVIAGVSIKGVPASGSTTDALTERFRIDPSGNIGIGTTVPTSLLSVNGAVTGKALSVFNETGNQDIFTASASGLTRFVIQNNGNVGIGGIANPTALLQVLGAASTTPTASISARSSFAGLVVDNTVGDLITASSSGLTRWVVKQNGNMGLGLSNPTAAKFVISDSSLAPGIDMQQISATTGTTTNGVDGLQIDIANAGSSANTNAGLNVNVTSNNTNASSNLYGVNIAALLSGGENANEVALNIGSGWDKGIVIASGNNDGTGLVYSGSGRPTKTISLQPEYAGGVITAFYGTGTDSSITGSMTSDTDTSGNLLRNYYQWTSSQGSLNYYTVAVRVRLPKDFSAWATSNAVQVDYATQSTSSSNNLVNVYIYNADDTPGTAVTSSVNNVSSVASTWTTVTIDDSVIDDGGAPDWDAADESAVIYLRLGSLSSNVVKIGEIRLSYLAAF